MLFININKISEKLKQGILVLIRVPESIDITKNKDNYSLTLYNL